MSDRLLRAVDVAELLDLSPATIIRWSESGKLPFIRLGGTKQGRLRFRESDIESLLESWASQPPEKVA
jgi:excisionase family DNA binding protein